MDPNEEEQMKTNGYWFKEVGPPGYYDDYGVETEKKPCEGVCPKPFFGDIFGSPKCKTGETKDEKKCFYDEKGGTKKRGKKKKGKRKSRKRKKRRRGTRKKRRRGTRKRRRKFKKGTKSKTQRG